MSRVRCVCVWEVRWPTSPSGFDCVRLAASVRSSSHKYQCSRVDLSRKPHKGRSAEALTRGGKHRGHFSEMLEILQWLCGSESFQLRNVTYILCPLSRSLSLCVSAVNTGMLTAVTRLVLQLLFCTSATLSPLHHSQAKWNTNITTVSQKVTGTNHNYVITVIYIIIYII